MIKVKVNISNEQKAVKVPSGLKMLVRRACIATLVAESFPDSAEVNVTFVDDDEIARLNAQFRKLDQPTDVLSFPLGENGQYDVNPETGAKLLGDVVISLPRAVEQAKKYGHTMQREVAYLTVHSVLHILGYDHEAGPDRVVMREHEETVLQSLGLTRSSDLE